MEWSDPEFVFGKCLLADSASRLRSGGRGGFGVAYWTQMAAKVRRSERICGDGCRNEFQQPTHTLWWDQMRVVSPAEQHCGDKDNGHGLRPGLTSTVRMAGAIAAAPAHSTVVPTISTVQYSAVLHTYCIMQRGVSWSRRNRKEEWNGSCAQERHENTSRLMWRLRSNYRAFQNSNVVTL